MSSVISNMRSDSPFLTTPIFVLIKENDSLVLKAINLKDLFHDAQGDALFNKCAFYLLFQELHHVNSFLSDTQSTECI